MTNAEPVDENGIPLNRPDTPSDKLVLWVLKSNETSSQNALKPLMVIEELTIPHHIALVAKPLQTPWFREINPHGMVPAIEAPIDGPDPGAAGLVNGKRLNVWESQACLLFLVDAYDKDGLFGGKNLWERTQVANWLSMHTAALGAQAKFWLVLAARTKEEIGNTMDILVKQIAAQYTILERRLNEPSQDWIALPDRPTIADIANLPFANAKIAMKANIDLKEYPKLYDWSLRMFARPAVQRALERSTKFGHE